MPIIEKAYNFWAGNKSLSPANGFGNFIRKVI